MTFIPKNVEEIMRTYSRRIELRSFHMEQWALGKDPKRYILFRKSVAKGQLISEWIYEVIVSPKKTNEILQGFLP